MRRGGRQGRRGGGGGGEEEEEEEEEEAATMTITTTNPGMKRFLKVLNSQRYVHSSLLQFFTGCRVDKIHPISINRMISITEELICSMKQRIFI